MKITEEIEVEEEYSNHPEDKSKEKEEECEKKEKNPKITKFYEEETISNKKINNDEPNVIKKEHSKERIDEELEVLKKEIEDEFKVTKERPLEEEDKNMNK